MATQKQKSATIVVFLEDGAPESHELTSDKDWSVIFEDVLEVKAKEGTTYYPLDAVKKWTVRPGRVAFVPAAAVVEAGKVETKGRA